MLTHRRSTQRAGWPLRAGRQLALALLIAASAICAAATTSGQFRVVVELFDFKNTVQCGTSGDRVVSLTCTETGDRGNATVRPQQPLYLFLGNEWLGSVDAMMTTGTVTSWRVVRVANRDYLEIVVGW